MNEEWRRVDGFMDAYIVSSLGRVKVLERTVFRNTTIGGPVISFKYKERLLTQTTIKGGYLRVALWDGKKHHMKPVHRLVLCSFVGQPEVGMECCHNNGNPADNALSNLRWDTRQANVNDVKKMGGYKTGEQHHLSRLHKDDVIAVRASGMDNSQIMRELGVSKSHAQRIRTNKTWRCV